MTYYPRDGRSLVNGHDVNTGGRGSTSRGDTAGGQDPTESASRNHAAMRRRQIAESAAAVSHDDAMQDVYAERAARKEAERSDLELSQLQKEVRRDVAQSEAREKEPEIREFLTANRHPVRRNFPSEADFQEAARQWEDGYAAAEAAVSGRELAARIAAGTFRPWTR
ncbi:hypothetical protein ABZ567_00380 [Streptomyces sp. NPDC016459]|uniref:hypothetical protein n=1 Tax=Streptomyces sp. NPDC016459 TaxID=3157190 RepID=UPI0033C5C0EC